MNFKMKNFLFQNWLLETLLFGFHFKKTINNISKSSVVLLMDSVKVCLCGK